jgi:hypothetical protein
MRLAFGDFDMTPSVAAPPLIATTSFATEFTDPPNLSKNAAAEPAGRRCGRKNLMKAHEFCRPGRMAYDVVSCKPDLNSLPVNASP